MKSLEAITQPVTKQTAAPPVSLSARQQIAAWKIKYYISLLICKTTKQTSESEKVQWKRQGKGMHKTILALKEELAACQSELKNASTAAIKSLNGSTNQEQLDDHSYPQTSISLPPIPLSNPINPTLDSSQDLGLSVASLTEELRISRRSCQDLLRQITIMEVLNEEKDRISSEQAASIIENRKVIESLQMDMKRLVIDSNQKQELMEKSLIAANDKCHELSSKVNYLEHERNEAILKNSDLENKSKNDAIQAISLQRLLAEVSLHLNIKTIGLTII